MEPRFCGSEQTHQGYQEQCDPWDERDSSGCFYPHSITLISQELPQPAAVGALIKYSDWPAQWTVITEEP